MTQFIRKNLGFFLVMICLIGAGFYAAYVSIEYRKLQLDSQSPILVAFAERVRALFILTLALLGSVFWTIRRRLLGMQDTQRWLAGVIRIQGERLEALNPKTDPETKMSLAHHWPWGNHHTEYLGHLEAAAQKFWVLYDPSDPTTAPTNEMVSDWLRENRNLSKERARAIASMLRPDGLPTGPR